MAIARPLPAGYYEHLALTRPHILEEVESMAAIAAEKGIGEDFRTVDDFGVDFQRVLQRELVCQARASGLDRKFSADDLERRLQVPRELKAQLAMVVDDDLAMLAAHRLAGMAIYRLSDGLASRLADTTMNMPTDLMRLPHSSIMLILDDPRSVASFQSMAGGRKPKGAISVFIRETNDERGRLWSIRAMQTHNRQVQMRTVRRLDCGPGRDAEAALRTDWSARGIHDPLVTKVAAMSGSKIQADDEIHYTAGLDFYRIVLNAVFYITSHNPAASKPRRNQGRLATDRVNFCGRMHIALGDGMTVLDKRPRDGSSCRGAPRTGRAQEGIQRIMGHWKVQAHGPRSSLRRTIFVEPYYRGNDAAALVVRAAAVA